MNIRICLCCTCLLSSWIVSKMAKSRKSGGQKVGNAVKKLIDKIRKSSRTKRKVVRYHENLDELVSKLDQSRGVRRAHHVQVRHNKMATSCHLPVGTNTAVVFEMGTEELRKYCTFKDGGNVCCNICNKELFARGDIAKFKRHLMCHAPDPGFRTPEHLTLLWINNMTENELKKHCRMQNDGKILCNICKIALNANADGKIAKFKRHLRFHALPNKRHRRSPLPVNLTDDELRGRCTFLTDGVISCNVCKIKLKARGSIAKFRRHFRTHSAVDISSDSNEDSNQESEDEDGEERIAVVLVDGWAVKCEPIEYRR